MEYVKTYENNMTRLINNTQYENSTHVSKQDKNAFIMKVFGIVLLQLGVVLAMCIIIFFNVSVQEWCLSHSYVFYLSLLFTIVFMILAMCFSQVYPLNSISLSIFTISSGYGIALGNIYIDGYILLCALGLTCLDIVLCICFVYYNNNVDVSKYDQLLFSSLSLLVVFSICNLFVEFGSWVHVVVSFFGICVFTGYIIYDVYELVNRLRPEQYIEASISLYLDVLNLFIRFMECIMYCVYAESDNSDVSCCC